MVNVSWKVEYYNDLSKTGTPDDTIEAFSNIQLITSAGDGRDSFQFDVKTNAPTADKIGLRDKIQISRTTDGSFNSDDVIMAGAVNKFPRQDQTSESRIKVKGNNFSKTLMDATVFADVRNTKVDEALQEALNSIKNYSQDFGVDWNSDNPSLQTDDTEFPEVGERWYDMPMRRIMEDYTKATNTEDGDYYWYVNANNELIWRPEADDVQDTLADGYPYKSVELKRDSEDVVNFVKVKGGTLPTGGAIEARYIDFGSAGKHNLRYKAIQGNENYVDDHHNETMNNIGATENDIRPSEVSGFSYPLSSSNLAFETSQTINSDEDYFDALKQSVKQNLRDDGQSFVQNNKNGYFQLELEVHPHHNIFQLGELYTNQLSVLPQSVQNKQFRVREIQYTSTIDVITLREDNPSV